MVPNNKLAHLKDFQKALRNYVPSIEVIDLLNQVQVVFLVAPAASGRNTIIRNMIMTGRYYYLISDTTRRPRINNGVPERNGEEYWFKSELEFLDGLKRGEYIEAAIIHEQQVSGTSISELRTALEKNLDDCGDGCVRHWTPFVTLTMLAGLTAIPGPLRAGAGGRRKSLSGAALPHHPHDDARDYHDTLHPHYGCAPRDGRGFSAHRWRAGKCDALHGHPHLARGLPPNQLWVWIRPCRCSCST